MIEDLAYVEMLALCWHCGQPTTLLCPSPRGGKLTCFRCNNRHNKRGKNRRHKKKMKNQRFREYAKRGVQV